MKTDKYQGLLCSIGSLIVLLSGMDEGEVSSAQLWAAMQSVDEASNILCGEEMLVAPSGEGNGS